MRPINDKNIVNWRGRGEWKTFFMPNCGVENGGEGITAFYWFV